jgi:transposase-like protein
MEPINRNFATPKGLTLMQIQQRFPTPEAAREYLEKLHWPNGPVCPHCGEMKRIYAIAANPAKKVRAGLKKCGKCRKQFTVTVGTIFEDSHVPLNMWLIAVYLLCSSKKGMSAHQLHRMLGVTYRTAWFMFHRLRFAVRQPSFKKQLGGDGKVVEADETWIGGRKHRSRARGESGLENKTTVFAMVERNGDVRSLPMGSVTASGLRNALKEHVDPNTRIMTDSNNSYRYATTQFISHEKVNHHIYEYFRKPDITTNTVELILPRFSGRFRYAA